MHIRFNRSLRGDYGHARPGDVKLVTKDIGKNLVSRGLAVEVEAPADAPAEPATEGDAPAAKDAKPAKGAGKTQAD